MSFTGLTRARHPQCFSVMLITPTQRLTLIFFGRGPIGASIICGDDYNLPHEDGVRRAVDEMGGPSELVDGFLFCRPVPAAGFLDSIY